MPNIPVNGDMEGFGIVLLEAASCGTSIVASNIEGIKDAIKDGKNGFLIEVYNVGRFVKIINRLLDNNEKKEKNGTIIREFTLQNYEWKKIAEKYVNCFANQIEA